MGAEQQNTVFEELRMSEMSWCWSVTAAPLSVRLSQISIAPSTGVAVATPAFPLTPCEQSHRISPGKELKCHRGSLLCHVGLRRVSISLHNQWCNIDLCVHHSLLDKPVVCKDNGHSDSRETFQIYSKYIVYTVLSPGLGIDQNRAKRRENISPDKR